MFEINTYPKDKEILLRKTVPIDEKLIPDLIEFIDAMEKYVLEDDNAIGLAANQVWSHQEHACPSIFVMGTAEQPGVKTFINPIVHFSGPTIKHIEGCLSRPGKVYYANRAKNVSINYIDREGQEKTEKYTGVYAQIIGHEMQHLEGKILKKEVKIHKYAT